MDRKFLSIEHYDTSEELNDAVTKKNFSFAIQLDDSLKGLTLPKQLPDNIKIYIRLPSQIYSTGKKIDWYTKSLFPKLLLEKGADFTDYDGKGFLHLQQILALALLKKMKEKHVPEIIMQAFPYPQMIKNWLNTTPAQTVSIFLIIMAFITNINNIITDVAVEKETQVKEYMKVMGLSGWLLWLTWFLRSFFILLSTVAIMTIILKVTILRPPVFIHTDGTILFALFLVYASSLITFMFLISTIFQKAIFAIVVGVIMYMVALILGVVQFIISASLYMKIITSVLSPSAMFFGLSMLFELEAKEKGGHWNSLFQSSWLENKASLGVIFVILILDTVLYMVIALYLEAVIPGEFGVPRPWYFPFTRTFWCKSLPEKTTEEFSQKDKEHFEEFTDSIPVGIKLKKLSKRFGSNNAVKDLNLEMYEGHITALLGHNGAGKSTTMSMICGMCLPTSGTAIVNGYDVRTNIHNVRESMGLCPQHNLLFDDLTVYEHLYFFGKLKDLENDEIKKEIDYYLTILELENKRKQLSKTLSGGMKRKLSVAIALCGKSRVIMLDEPTAGMDPSARRTVWDLLQQQKNGRTILLTTHYMDEADLLGDRIAIMTAGELQSCGSSFFLRKKYGSDYYLILEVTPKCRPVHVTGLLAKYVPNIQIHSHVGSELTYILPDKASEKFETLLKDLEYNKPSLGIQNLGISLATLEEVFLKVAAAHDMKISEKFNKKETDVEVFIPTMAYLVLEQSEAATSTRMVLEWVFLFTPYYSVVNGITAIITTRDVRKGCQKTMVPREVLCEVVKACCYEDFYYSFEEPGIGRNIFIPLIMSFILFTIIFLTEFNFFSRICIRVRRFHKPPNENVILESDVHNENEKIRNTSVDELKKSYSVVLRDVSKYYGKFLAVNCLCLGVNSSECFGLLGVNGAGKTTTFKMLTGDESITFGDAWIQGLCVKTQQKQVQKFIGYCPQFDALLEDLTAKETLFIFALIRGVSFDKCIALVESLAETFDFFEHINKKIKHLSGGNKRKVSTALAIIGDPPIIFLDEPSAGMDPVTKRFLWNNLIRLRDAGKCIVLTSHSMEECEALCTRVAIMVNGTFQCLGSTQRLKSKYAQGYTLKIKVKKHDDHTRTDSQISAVNNFVQKYFPGSELKERYQELVTYHLDNPKSLSLSQMFGTIEASKRQLGIEDYSLGQCSLEEVLRKANNH
ncbi:ATP-binding cassette sub-family A member 3-like Protein [Tribolium castaneum]|uniref:ATP-binding cassette sub-family A member 3-like Protein n=1 Tax=Tribolium castaneum TaxID=7070 RepID=A0A139WBK2_TRICA|nr:ATP-binding cassette sub-family A member 3-like Protein [Tribolium castaneum]